MLMAMGTLVEPFWDPKPVRFKLDPKALCSLAKMDTADLVYFPWCLF